MHFRCVKRVVATLGFGQAGLPLAFPVNAELPSPVEFVTVRKAAQPVPADAQAVILRALDEPVGGPRCSIEAAAAAARAKTAVIVICDITRPVPNSLFLRIMIERLAACGVSAEHITVLVATGLHRPNLGAELAELIGDPWVLESSGVRVVNNMARDDDAFVDLGATPTHQVPVKINRLFVEADVKICTGLIEPHFMAGYSGGRKVIAPGVAHHSLIRTFHSARFMEHPSATVCNLVNNPLHQTQLEIVSMIQRLSPDVPILALNTVLDEHRRLVFCTFGEILLSHARAVTRVRACAEIVVPRRFQTVITSAGGAPLDRSFYQTVKGMITCLDILQPGGTLIVCSACDTLGSAEFVDAQRRLIALGPRAFVESLTSKALADIDEWQTEELVRGMVAGRIVLFAPHLSDVEHACTGVERASDPVAAVLSSALRAVGGGGGGGGGCVHVAVIPEGPYVVPFCRPGQ